MIEEGFINKLAHPAYSWIEGHHETNTWERRHENTIARAKEILTATNLTGITIAIYGPGGIAEEYADKLPSGDESLFKGSYLDILLGREVKHNFQARLRRAKQQLIGRKETEARNKPESNLVTFEPREWYGALNHLGIKSLTVFDKYSKVKKAVEKLGLERTLAIQRDLDNAVTPFPERYDVVIALKLFEYCTNFSRAYQHVANSVKPDSWLIATFPEDRRIETPGFVKKADRIYYKGSQFKAPLINEVALAPHILGEK